MTHHEAITWVAHVLKQCAEYAGDATTNGDFSGFILEDIAITDTEQLKRAYALLCAHPPVDDLNTNQQWELVYRRYLELSMQDA